MNYQPPRHKRTFRLVAPLTAGLSILLVFSAFGGSSAFGSGTSTKTQQMSTAPIVKGSGGTVIVRAQEDIDTFNPAIDNGTYLDFSTYAFTYDTLATLSPQGNLRPGLATKWTGTPLKVTFWIHKGATCDDGTPVTPAVIANSMNYYANPKTGAGIESVIFGLGSADATANAAADTVTITVSKPWGYLLDGAATAAYVICPAGLKNPSLMSEKPVGSGPYEMTSDERGVEYTLQARPKYNWGPGGWSTRDNGVPQKIIERVIVNPVTAMNEGLTGALQIDGYINGKAVEEMKSRDPSLMYQRQADLGAMGMVFNPIEPKSAPVSDPVVREAVDLAINRNDFMLAAAGGQGVVSKTMLTPGMTCYSPALGKYAAPYDATKAEQILKADGWKLNSSGKLEKNGQPLTIRIAESNVWASAGAYVLDALDSIGMSASVAVLNDTTLLNTLYTTHQYDIIPYAYQDFFTTPSVMPSQDIGIGIKDPAYYAAVDAAGALPVAQSCPAWNKALRIELNFVDPLGYNDTTWFSAGFKFSVKYGYIDPFTFYKVS